MKENCVKFCLMIVTTEGWYPALSGTPPHHNPRDIRDLEDVIHSVKPGYGKHYLTHIVRCNDDKLTINELEYPVLERYKEQLLKRARSLENSWCEKL
jgi:hypothetical protein